MQFFFFHPWWITDCIFIPKEVTLRHLLASHLWTFLGMVQASQSNAESELNKAAGPPKTFMSKIMSGQSSQLVSRSSSVLYILWDFDRGSMIDAIFFIHVGLSLWSKL